MRSQVTLLLLCTFVSTALSLKCYQCIPTGIGPCTNTQIDCPSQCLAASVTTTMSGISPVNINLKTCGEPQDCKSESFNFGVMKVNTNTQCCSTDLCNSQTPPAPVPQSPNGRMCYSCDDKVCTNTVACEGNENRCISASVNIGAIKTNVKGCTTKSACEAAGQQQGVTMTSVSCCEGNLCNGAEGFALSFLLMLLPLLSSILLY